MLNYRRVYLPPPLFAPSPFPSLTTPPSTTLIPSRCSRVPGTRAATSSLMLLRRPRDDAHPTLRARPCCRLLVSKASPPSSSIYVYISAACAAIALASASSFRPPAAYAYPYTYHDGGVPPVSLFTTTTTTTTTAISISRSTRSAYVACPPKRFALVTYKLGREAECEMLVRMCVAIGCGAMIGLERQSSLYSSSSASNTEKTGTAGVRTLSLVALGSSVFTLTALLSLSGDAGRMGAAISTGIGFLGAGTIHHDKAQRHLVTAASVWISAALGVAAASGLKFLAVVVAIATIAILRSKSIYVLLRKYYIRALRWRKTR